MKLLPQELERKLPSLGTESEIALVKWFTPDSNFTWYVAEYDPETGDCFGLVDGLEKELGYFNLKEIQKLRGKFNLPVERDRFFDPTPLLDLME
jgi:hypothetical protein